ncbi:MAG TPA: cytochrome c3 family protein [Terriglobales bacterium]|nr:cytochrome c3 family protein [Terriglobales bacterium]
MKLKLLALVVLAVSFARAQSGDVLGAHDLSMAGSSHIKGYMSAACLYCHVPHSGKGKMALWGQELSTQIYSTYVSTTAQNTTEQPPLGENSSLCLSCHDGTVGVGQVSPYGPYTMTGKMDSTMGSQLQGSHPFSLKLPLKDASNLVASLAASGKTADTTDSVKLIRGNVECASCHNPHIQSVDKESPNFLVLVNAKGAICLACHDPNPRTVNGRDNTLAMWSLGIHATASNAVSSSANLGGYKTVADLACQSCHVSHGAGGASGLLRSANESDCIVCHSGASTLSPPAPNVFVEFGKQGAHPFSTSTGTHDQGEPALLNQNRHATCADCHNSHSAQQVVSFPMPPNIRASQGRVDGISASDGVTVQKPAVNQYENCLRCHGTSTGKTTNPVAFGYLPVRVVTAPDPLNVIPEFSITATSSHNVFHDRSSPLPQISLRSNMMQLDGVTPGRAMGTRILCSDCHNADDNREFGGSGANGPHGSKWSHLLERRYEYNQAAVPGGTVTNLFPTPDLSVNGPYGLCAKCHDLNQVLSASSWSEHARHINDGFSCSTCHTAHGMGAVSGSISGERLVNFDGNVVGPNNTAPITYDRNNAAKSCTLMCHNHAH